MREVLYLAAFAVVCVGLVGGVYLAFVGLTMTSRRATEHRARLAADLDTFSQRYQRFNIDRCRLHYGIACASPGCPCGSEVRERGYAPSTSEVLL